MSIPLYYGVSPNQLLCSDASSIPEALSLEARAGKHLFIIDWVWKFSAISGVQGWPSAWSNSINPQGVAVWLKSCLEKTSYMALLATLLEWDGGFFFSQIWHSTGGTRLSYRKAKFHFKFKVFSVLKLRGKVSDTDGYNLTNSNDESNAVV